MRADTTRQHAYSRVADSLRREIARGVRTPSRLPTEEQLARQHGVSRQTVRRAYQELVSEGLVERTRRRGTFPLPRSSYVRSLGSIEDVMAFANDTVMEVVRPLSPITSWPHNGETIPESDSMRAEVRRLSDGIAFSYSLVTVPADIGKLLSRTMLARKGARAQATVLHLIADATSERVTQARQVITVASVPARGARLIGMKPGTCTLRIDRAYSTKDGRVIETSINFYNPARYTYRLELRHTGR